MSSLGITLNLLGSGLLLVLIGVLIRHKLYSLFPPFFAYCIFAIVAVVADITLGKHPIVFFVVHWLAQGVYVVLAFVAMLSVLRPFIDHAYVRHPWSRLLLLPFVALTIGLPLWNAISNPINRTLAGRFASAIYVFVIIMSLAEVALWVVSSRTKGWDFSYFAEQAFAILRGFGVLASVNLVAYMALVLRLLHLKVGTQLESIFQIAPSGAFIGSATVWLIAFWKPEDLPSEPPDMGRMKDALRVMQEQLDADLDFVRELAKRLGIRLAAA